MMTCRQLTERDCREWKLHVSTLMTETPGDPMGDLACVQQASYLEGGGRGGGVEGTDVDIAYCPFTCMSITTLPACQSKIR